MVTALTECATDTTQSTTRFCRGVFRALSVRNWGSTMNIRSAAVPIAVLLSFSACAKNQANTTPELALTKTDEGLPPSPRAAGRSPRTVGDTTICEKPRKFSTPDGNRWLWVRIMIERKPGETTDNTIAETVVSTNPEGTEYATVGLAGVKLDTDKEYTLRNTSGVRTLETKKSDKQAHRVRGYAVQPNLGPIEATCGS